MKWIYFLIISNFLGGYLNAQDKVPAKYDYPIEQSSHLITYSKTESVSADKKRLFKRAHQFLAVQSFDRATEVKTKVGGYYSGPIIEKAVTYDDEEEGKIWGNGFFDFVYRNKKYFVVTFSYKLYIQDNQYKYVFSCSNN